MNHFSGSNVSINNNTHRGKQKIGKSNSEFKEHERIIMDKRIAEINNVITKKCHTLWNQYLFMSKKPHTLQFNFVYHGLESYLKKCDDYKAEQHKDNKQKWWNNQKASEMSQQFLPSVLNSTDHMAQYIGKQIRDNLQTEFTNYVTFELLETAITSVFSTQRSGSNEVFLRTSFQYAKAGLRKKLVSYFGDGELREYDTKSRKKKDLWQRLIKEKKEKLIREFEEKKNMFSVDSKVGILNHNDISCYNDYEYQQDNDSTMYINPPPSTQQAQFDNNNGYNEYAHNNGYHNLYDNNNLNLMDGLNMNGMNNGTLPFPQPLLMDITLTYPPNGAANNNSNNNNEYHTQQQARIPPPIHCIPTKTEYQCRQCLQYMSKISDLLKVNQAINDDTAQLKQVNIKYEAERDHWKSQYQQLFKQYQNLLRQNNDLQQQQLDDEQIVPLSPHQLKIKTDNMSVSSNNNNDNNCSNNNNNDIIPLDDLAKTPKELQAFTQFGMNDNSSITPYDNGINPFPFPSNDDSNNNDDNDDIENKSKNSPKSEMSSSIFSHNNNNNNNNNVNGNNKEVMSVCSDKYHQISPPLTIPNNNQNNFMSSFYSQTII